MKDLIYSASNFLKWSILWILWQWWKGNGVLIQYVYSFLKADSIGFDVVRLNCEQLVIQYPCYFLVSSAAGHEDFCGHGLRHPPGASAAEGYNREGPRHRRCHQAVQQVCQAGLRAVHRAHHAPGRHRGATWCVIYFYFFLTTVLLLIVIVLLKETLSICLSSIQVVATWWPLISLCSMSTVSWRRYRHFYLHLHARTRAHTSASWFMGFSENMLTVLCGSGEL